MERFRDYPFREYCPFKTDGKRLASESVFQKDDDIVHPFKKFKDKCNRLVAGSSPARGAKLKTPLKKVVFLILLRGRKQTALLSSGLERRSMSLCDSEPRPAVLCLLKSAGRTKDLVTAGRVLPKGKNFT